MSLKVIFLLCSAALVAALPTDSAGQEGLVGASFAVEAPPILLTEEDLREALNQNEEEGEAEGEPQAADEDEESDRIAQEYNSFVERLKKYHKKKGDSPKEEFYFR
ncbi:uncharacterized protein LOC127004820 [Eriocheir sinensis]|uniref:uncharacterized protein LOC127004820 n=1 Tax=Eriocheir sinensis TaxID=95602 RepID=UPI0021C7383E|nr:uncharacterized protein LOC127004820 [Eriocheir sinensis]